MTQFRNSDLSVRAHGRLKMQLMKHFSHYQTDKQSAIRIKGCQCKCRFQRQWPWEKDDGDFIFYLLNNVLTIFSQNTYLSEMQTSELHNAVQKKKPSATSPATGNGCKKVFVATVQLMPCWHRSLKANCQPILTAGVENGQRHAQKVRADVATKAQKVQLVQALLIWHTSEVAHRDR